MFTRLDRPPEREPPEEEDRPLTWPYWPYKMRSSSSHEEGCERAFAIATKAFNGSKGKLTSLTTVHVEFKDGKLLDKLVGGQPKPQLKAFIERAF